MPYSDTVAAPGSRASPAIPASVDQIDLQWVQAVLAGTSGVDPGLLRGLNRILLDEGRGFVAQLVRLQLDWRGATRAPASLIVKLHAAVPEKADAAKKLYEREYLFYRHFAARTPIPTPLCYHAAYDAADAHFVLVLEDLGHLEPGDQIKGTTDANAVIAVRNLARLHAEFWDDEGVKRTFGDMADPLPEIDGSILDLMQTNLAEIKASRAKQLPMMIRTVETIQEVISAPDFNLNDSPLPSPYTLIHVDYRLDNAFFTVADGAITMIDWCVSVGRGSADLMYFISGNLTPEQICRNGQALIGCYHEALVQHGVENYSLKQLKNHCIGASVNIAWMLASMQAVLDRIDRREMSTADKELSFLGGLGLILAGLIEDDRGREIMETWVIRAEASLISGFPGGRFGGWLLLTLLRDAAWLRNRYLRWRNGGPLWSRKR